MFRSIKGTLLQKQDTLSAQSSVGVLVRQAVQDFLRENYPDGVESIGVRYQPEEKLVVISTPSKTLAGELTLNTREIRAHLTSHDIRVDRIVIR